eukprot:27068_1
MATTTTLPRPLRPERVFQNHYSTKHQKRITCLILLTVAICLLILTFAWRHKQTYTVQLSQYLINANINTNLDYIDALEPNQSINTQQSTHMNRLQYIQFESSISIPNFYIRPGIHTHGYDDDLVTLCSVSSVNTLRKAQRLARNYKSGPLSFAVYIGQDISSHSIDSQTYLASLFAKYFRNIPTPYDIYIGLVYVDTNHTEMSSNIPVNAMRNVAEYQVNTKWLLNVDVDFEFYSFGINNHIHIHTVVKKLNTHDDDSLYIVPAFAIDSVYLDGAQYNDMTRSQLLSLVNKSIVPFYEGEPHQQCTDYQYWYKAKRDYELIYEDMEFCDKCQNYRPFFIIKTAISRRYSWNIDDSFTGCEGNEVQRMQYLRYYNFSAIVMRDLFMIHAINTDTNNQQLYAPVLQSKLIDK